jgi:hypothetical protein
VLQWMIKSDAAYRAATKPCSFCLVDEADVRTRGDLSA